MADLVESLRMSGINYLPRSVSNPKRPEPVQRISVECEALQADSGQTVPPARLNPQPEDGSPSAKESGSIQSENQPLRNRLPVAASGLFALDAPDPSSVVQEETASLSPDQRRERLRRLAEEVSRCSKCAELARGRTKTVFGVGPIDAELCVVGEAPGAQEDLKGEPFVGDAGQLLDKILKAIGFDRFYPTVPASVESDTRCRGGWKLPTVSRGDPGLGEAEVLMPDGGNGGPLPS